MTVAERREREKQQRRDHILDAAEVVFARKGVALATVGAIAKQAEIAKGTVYLYFQSKDDVLLAIATRAMQAIEQRLRTVSAGPGLARLGAIGRAYAAYATENKERFRLAVGWMASGGSVDQESSTFHEHKTQIARIFAVIFAAAQLGKDDGSIRSDLDPVRVATHLWGGLFGHLVLALNAPQLGSAAPQEIDLQAIAPSFVNFYVEAISAGAQ